MMNGKIYEGRNEKWREVCNRRLNFGQGNMDGEVSDGEILDGDVTDYLL